MVLRAVTIAMLAAALFVASFAVGARLSASERSMPSPDAPSPTLDVIEALLSGDPSTLPPPSSGTTIVGYTRTTTTTTELVDETVDAPRIALDIDPMFDGISSALAEVSIPVRLPAAVPQSMAEFAATVGRVDANGYVVHLAESAACAEDPDCRNITFTGRRSTSLSPRPTTAGTEVPLPNGLVGWFADSICTTDCDSSFLTWIEDDVRYSVGTRAASGTATLDLAWLALDSTLPSPSSPEICGPGAPAWDGRVARTLTTVLDDARELHWVVVCSDAGTRVEIVEAPGTIVWLDLDRDAVKGPAIKHPDGTTSVFSLVDEEPRPAIDLGRGGRLLIGELRCADVDGDGNVDVIDAETAEQLRFDGSRAVRRVAPARPVQGTLPCP